MSNYATLYFCLKQNEEQTQSSSSDPAKPKDAQQEKLQAEVHKMLE